MNHYLFLHRTCVVKDGVFDGAVLKEGVGWLDVLKVAVLEQRVLKLDGLYLDVSKPKRKESQIILSRVMWHWCLKVAVLKGRTCRECTLPRGGSDWPERSWSGSVQLVPGGTLAPWTRTPRTACIWSCPGTTLPAHGNWVMHKQNPSSLKWSAKPLNPLFFGIKSLKAQCVGCVLTSHLISDLSELIHILDYVVTWFKWTHYPCFVTLSNSEHAYIHYFPFNSMPIDPFICYTLDLQIDPLM